MSERIRCFVVKRAIQIDAYVTYFTSQHYRPWLATIFILIGAQRQHVCERHAVYFVTAYSETTGNRTRDYEM